MKNEPTGGPSGLGPDERLPVPAQRPGPRAGAALLAALHLFRRGARSRCSDYVASVAGPVADRPASHGRGPARRLRRPAARASSMLDRLGPAINSGRGLFLYGPPGNGKTSIAERVTARLRPGHLDSPGDRRRRRDHPPLRPGQPRGSAAGARQRAVRPPQDRQPLGPHSPADDRRRRRTDHVAARGDDQHLDRHQRGPAATEEQLRHAGDRRLRPAADAHRRAAEPLDRAAGKARTTSSTCPTARRSRCPSTS